jgi:hypothetical protein
MQDLKNNIDVVNSIVPAVRNVLVNGTGVDLANRDSAVVIFAAGALTDGTHTPKIQDSPDNVTFADVAAALQEGVLVNITANSVQRVGYKGAQRFIRPVVTSSGVTGAAYGATVVRGAARKQPLP